MSVNRPQEKGKVLPREARSYDRLGRLVSSTAGGETTIYAYDAAGRLVREGGRAYRYGYLDKVLAVTEGGRTLAYACHPDGQLARADYGGGRTEEFEWDGLALVRRGDERFVNEPHPDGWNPFAYCGNNAVCFVDLFGAKRKFVELSECQSFDMDVEIIWLNADFSILSTYAAMVREAAKAGLTVQDYVCDKVKGYLEDGVRDMATNYLLSLMLKGFADAQGLGFETSLPTNQLTQYLDDGWIIEDWKYYVTIEDSDRKISGTISIAVSECTHHWSVTLIKE